MSGELIKFKERIKEVREALGLNKSQFAKYLKTTASNITRYESGDVNTSLGTINLIADRLNCDPAWLLGWEDDQYANIEMNFKKVPQLGLLKPGIPIMDPENFEGFQIIKVEAEADPDFCYRINYKFSCINEGSIVFFQKSKDYSNGDIVAIVEGELIKVNRYFRAGKNVLLNCENTTEEKEADKVNVLGKAVKFLAGVV
jgi:transcriptional regulator with XRE-family HTH domain